MEGFITLIIIIVIFNIFNMLLRALKGGKTPAKQSVLVTAEQFLQDNISIQKEKSNQPLQEEVFRDTEPERDILPYSKRYTEDIPPFRDEQSSKPKPGLQGPPAIKACNKKPADFSSNLQQVLTKKDPLLAAFVFHEILEPPPALRRKR